MFTYEDFQSLVGITDRDELMSAVAQVPKRQFIANNNLNSVADVYSLLRDSFKDILQELMEENWMPPLVMKRTRRAMLPHPISVTDILPKP